jgi:hypothetical protein
VKQWDIWTCDFAAAGPHPAVVVSHTDRVARAPLVNVLIGSSQRATRQPRENEVVLNGAVRSSFPSKDLSSIILSTYYGSKSRQRQPHHG